MQQDPQIGQEQPLQAKKSELESDIRQLELTKRMLIAKVDELRAQHDQFLDYERTVRADLAAQVKDLAAREGRLLTNEGLSESRRALLPKM